MRVVAGTLTEQEATRRIALAAGGLVLLGIALLVGTVLWWRSTRPESPALAPLEMMSGRRWAKASEAERRRLADQVRPNAVAAPVAPVPVSLAVDRSGDEAADRFDDLRDIDELLGSLSVAAAGTTPSAATEASADVAAPSAVVSTDDRDESARGRDHVAIDDETTDDVPVVPVVPIVARHRDATASIAIDPLLRLSQTD